MVGRAGFEPAKASADRFTVCSHWPLGHLPRPAQIIPLPLAPPFVSIGRSHSKSHGDAIVKIMLTTCITAMLLTQRQAHRSEPMLGINVEGIGGRGLEFIDVMRTSRAWEKPDGSGPAKMDEHGWPLEDARTVAFDMRPAMAWAPPMDDPAKFQIDVSGTYTLRFKGKATITSGEATVAPATFDEKTQTNVVSVTLPKGAGLLVLTFSHTENVHDVHLYRPHYKPPVSNFFTDAFMEAIRPFPVIRFMDWGNSNSTNPFFGDAHNTTDWADRHTQADCTYNQIGRKFGVPWEMVIAIGNFTGKDLWINIPAGASDDYVRQLATLMKSKLTRDSNLYLEYSNEVWNWGFLQATYNRMAAEAEVKAGKSDLNNDGETNWDVWRRRRHARRTMEIGRIFETAFGKGSLNTRIRPVMAWWAIAPDQYKDMLDWLQKTYGDPSKYLYAVALAPYFNIEGASKTATVDELLTTFKRSSDGSVKMRKAIIDLAHTRHLKAFCYEGGSDTGGGDSANVGNRIRAERDPRMEQIVSHDLRDNWYALGGDLFMYFTLTSAYSRYGCWGLTDDVTNLNTPKFRGALASQKR